MAALPPSVLETLDADESLWPGPEPRAALERWLAAVPSDVRDALLSALADPDRHAWSRAALWGIDLAVAAGATPTGLVNDEVVELTDSRGERFGLVPIAFLPRPHPLGEPETAEQLLRALDRVFDDRRYVLSVWRPLPSELELAPICSAVQLWLAQLEHGPGERHATYEDGEVSLDLTLVEGPRRPAARSGAGRLLTVGPMEAIEQLGELDSAIVDAASRCEESIGALPLLMVVGHDRRWRLPRGFAQQLLYGVPDAVRVEGAYEAEFTSNGRSLFSDGNARAIVEIWWIGPGRAEERCHRAYVNPWAAQPLALAVPGPRFAPVGEVDRLGRATLRWTR